MTEAQVVELQHLEHCAMRLLNEVAIPVIVGGYVVNDASRESVQRAWDKLKERHQALRAAVGET